MNLLHLDSSVLGDGSVTRELSAATVATLRREQPSISVVRRDLAADPLPHYDTVNLLGRQPAADWSKVDAAARAELERSQAVLDEFLAADVIVIGAPMYNFGVPSQLKAWIDRIAVAGKTFRYSETGPVGLAGGKRVIVLSARGGFYSAGPNAAADFQEAYLTQVFRFLGITDIEFVRAEGVGMGPEARAKAVSAALERIAGDTRLAA